MHCLKEKNKNALRWELTFLLCILGSLALHAQSLRFSMELIYDTNQLSGMLILKTEREVLKGSMVNEFGVNFVEFTVKNGKAKIVRINPMLKKPYLKKVLKRDFELLATCLNREGDEKIQNRRKGIYRASCAKQTDEETDLLSLRLEHQKLPLTIYLYQF